MDISSDPNHGATPLRGDFRSICIAITMQEAPPSEALRSLIALREDAPFARHSLAAQLSREVGMSLAVEASNVAVRGGAQERHLSTRDVIDYWGFRVTHSSSVLAAWIDYVGSRATDEANRDFWLKASVIATYAAVVADVLKKHQDEAFSASLLRSTALFFMMQHAPEEARAARRLAASESLPLWEAEARALDGNHLDLARLLVSHWGLPARLEEGLRLDDETDSLSDLLVRAIAAVERHGFEDPTGPIIPPRLRPEREPIADAYFHNGGGTPEAFIEDLRAMLALTSLVELHPAA